MAKSKKTFRYFAKHIFTLFAYIARQFYTMVFDKDYGTYFHRGQFSLLRYEGYLKK